MKYLRIGIGALVVFGVLAHGGVEEWAQAIFETGAGLLFLSWALLVYFERREQLVVSPLLPPLAAFAVVAACQWIFHLTASAYDTRSEFLLVLGDLFVLFVAAQVFRTLEDWRMFVWFAMTFGFAVAIFGILQHLTFNGKLYWFREMRYGGIPFGPYVNRNHFAGFAELVIPISLVPLMLGKVRRERWLVVGLFAILPMGALLLSASRGGIISFGVEVVFIVLWLFARRAGARQLGAGAALLAMALLLVVWLGAQDILQRFSAMQSLEMTEGKRAAMRRDTWHIFLEHPVIGTGLGTIQRVFPPYDTLYDGRIVNHSHNDYLETLAETGAVGGLVCAWFLSALFSDPLRRVFTGKISFISALHLAGFAGCIGFLAHSMVDFNLHLPANALLFFLMAHLATTEIERPATVVPRIHKEND